jgi:hypothetical protein
MKLLYYKIYYTIYRGLIWLGQTEETDSIRFNAIFIQSIFSMLFTVGVIGFLVALIGISIIIHSKVQGIMLALLIIGSNAYLIFYKNKNREVENALELTWSKNKSKNILLTLAFLVGSVAFFVLSIMYIKEHPLTK